METSVTFTGLRTWQQEMWQDLKRFTVVVAHRRSGKTVLSIIWLISRVAPIRNGCGVYFCPERAQAKRVAWDYFHRYAGRIPGTEFNESELKVTFATGATIYLLGADKNADNIRGLGLDGAVIDEVAQCGPSVWTTIIRPALSDRLGHALFIGTPLGRANQFHDLYEQRGFPEGWAKGFYPHTATGCIDPAEIETLRKEMGPAAFAQEYECSFDAAIKGAFYGQEMAAAELAGRVGNVPWDKALPVHSSWDLGFSDLTVIWCWQTVGAEIRAIECLSFQSASLPDIVADLRRRPYNWGQHYLPHDVKVRELGSGRSRAEILASLGIQPVVVQDHSVADGIECFRSMLSRIWFDREQCGAGVEALKAYRTDWDDKNRVFSKAPKHDWASHYADSARYWAMGTQGRKPAWGKLDYSQMDRAIA